MNILKKITSIIIFFTSLLLITSCEPYESSVGLELLSHDNLLQLGYTDSVTIRAHSVHEDSLNTSNSTFSLIGSMYDPIFGISNASFYTQIRPTTNSFHFDNTINVDSAILYLPYRGQKYGDTLSNMKYKVYLLNEKFPDTLKMFSHNTLNYETSDLIGEVTYNPSNSLANKFLRISLNDKFLEKIINVDTNNTNTIDAFLNYFYGIVITSDETTNPNSGSIVAFNTATDNSKITLYYKNTTDTIQSKYDFMINSSCKRFNHYSHNYEYSIPQLKDQISGDTSLGAHFVFLQAMSGVKTNIKFPYLKQLKQNRLIAINDAQLIIKNASQSDYFTPPSSLGLRAAGQNGTTSPIAIVDDGLGYFDGKYDKNTQTYRFRITRYLQQIIDDKVDNRNGLFLYIPTSNTGSRLVLHGYNSPETQIKLYIKFTIIE